MPNLDELHFLEYRILTYNFFLYIRIICLTYVVSLVAHKRQSCRTVHGLPQVIAERIHNKFGASVIGILWNQQPIIPPVHRAPVDVIPL